MHLSLDPPFVTQVLADGTKHAVLCCQAVRRTVQPEDPPGTFGL